MFLQSQSSRRCLFLSLPPTATFGTTIGNIKSVAKNKILHIKYSASSMVKSQQPR